MGLSLALESLTLFDYGLKEPDVSPAIIALAPTNQTFKELEYLIYGFAVEVVEDEFPGILTPADLPGFLFRFVDLEIVA